MDQRLYQTYINILEEELVPAMGCTEPISVAYCAAKAAQTLGTPVETVQLKASANIIKNVKSVVVPNTGGLRGLAAAAAAGIVAGDTEKELEVLSAVTPEQIDQIRVFLDTVPVTVERSENDYIFYISVCLFGGGHTALCEIAGSHTNIICLERDGKPQLPGTKRFSEAGSQEAGMEKATCADFMNADEKKESVSDADYSLLSVEEIVRFANEVKLDDVRQLLSRQIEYNTAIAAEGLKNEWGANIGRILIRSYGNSVHNRAKAWAAAGSDARMGGCELPVVINSGSGNQGLTASLPVIVYAREMGASEEQLYRALVISNLVTIHLKTGIGRLSAYCGATSAGCGAGAGVTYLYGGDYREIAHTIVNAVAINSGMICDGAKASCAAKIASAVEAGLLGMQMQLHGSEFCDGDGIVVKGVENTIHNVGELAREGMLETDREIIRLMIQKV
ncbi:MAG: L-serine ammonia-lyase, iron-sulfur-dependent, subunit alpha [Lachnospiraceae bacterium]|nr:L-serine ammonia-lyase, iron-sulfur-dependent, subunit alpha [Lachnospiraceae bacterium]